MSDLDELAKASSGSQPEQHQQKGQPTTGSSGDNQSLMYCRDCRGVVSTSARACPHCGRRFKASVAGIILTIVFIILALAVLQFIGQMVAFNRQYP